MLGLALWCFSFSPALSPALACPVGLCSVQALRCLLQAAAPAPPHGTQRVAMPVGQRLKQHARLALAQAHCQLPPLMGRQSPGAQCHSSRQLGWAGSHQVLSAILAGS